MATVLDQGVHPSFEVPVTQTPVGIAHLDRDGHFCWVNSPLCDWLGYAQSELLQLSLWDFIPPDDQDRIQTQLQSPTPSSSSQEQQFINRDHLTLWAQMTMSVVMSSGHADPRWVIILHDIHDRKLLEAKLHSAQQQMRAVFEAMQDIVLICTLQGETLAGIEVAPTAVLQLQAGALDLVNQTIQFLWREAKHWMPLIQQVLQTRDPIALEYGLPMDGDHRWFAVNLSPMSEQAVLWVARDISDRKQMEQALFCEKELAQVTLQSIGDAVMTTDTNSRITDINPAAETLTGWCKSEAIGQLLPQVLTLIHEDTRDLIANPVTQVLTQGQRIEPSNHTLLIARDGREYAIDDAASPIRDRAGQIIGVVLVFNDVTQARNAAHQLSWEANHDPLTHLINRRKFEQILSEALRDAHQVQQRHVLCFLDLDRFKVVNDTCGHGAGDALLCQIAELLQAPIRSADTVARLGGDEFVILLRQCALEPAQRVAETLRQSIQNFLFSWGSQTFQVGVSIGLVQIDHTSPSVEAVLDAADSSCYQAKAQGKNRVQVYGTEQIS